MVAIWLHRTGNASLDNVKVKRCAARFVCDDHFSHICKKNPVNDAKTNLKINALPTLHMPG